MSTSELIVLAALHTGKTGLDEIIAYAKDLNHDLTEAQVIDIMLKIAVGDGGKDITEVKKVGDWSSKAKSRDVLHQEIKSVCFMLQCLEMKRTASAVEEKLWRRFDDLATRLCE